MRNTAPEPPITRCRSTCCEGIFRTKKVIHRLAGGVPILASQPECFMLFWWFDQSFPPDLVRRRGEKPGRVTDRIFTSCLADSNGLTLLGGVKTSPTG